MKPNSCTEKAPTDVWPKQEMPVKKHTCTKSSIPRALGESRAGGRRAQPAASTPWG